MFWTISRIIQISIKKFIFWQKDVHEKLAWKYKWQYFKGSKKCLTKEQKKAYRNYYKNLGYRRVDLTYINNIYANCEIFSERFIPDYLINLYLLEWQPKIQDKCYQPDILHDVVSMPHPIIRSCNGVYLDSDDNVITEQLALKYIHANSEDLIIKPTFNSCASMNVYKMQPNEIDEKVFKKFGTDFVVQPYIQQHDVLKKLGNFYPATVRFITLVHNGKVEFLCSHIRSSYSDTKHQCMFVGVNCDGNLKDFAYYNNSEKIHKTNDGTLFSNIKIPYFEEMLNASIDCHKRMLRNKIITSDFIVTDKGFTLVEYNIGPVDWSLIYVLNGGDIFNDSMVKDILDASKKNKDKRIDFKFIPPPFLDRNQIYQSYII